MFYLILAIIVAVITEISFKVKSKFIRIICGILAILIPTFFFSVRYGIGTDYFNYLALYSDVYNGIDIKIEWAYKYLSKFVASFGGSIEVLFFIVSLIMILFIYLTLKDNHKIISPGVGMFVFMLLYYQYSFNIMRQMIAASIILYSIKYIKDRKFIKFMLFIFIASGFHITALIMVPIYFLYELLGKKKRKLISSITFLIALVVVLSLDKILIPILNRFESLQQYIWYLEIKSSVDPDLGFILYELPILFLGVYLYKKMERSEKNFNIYFSIYILGIIFEFSKLIGSDHISRLSINFEIVLVLLIPYFIRILNNRKELFISWLLLCYVVFQWWYSFIYLGNTETYPYQWIFNR